uniref:Periplasmic mercury(+2) binding protein n=1 Tax=Leclercia adecarboxylata TaxID=83655 RepID=A0A7D5G0H0_9ENTR|nr:Periplasmic mercury(+2) binding protein [Leclercia adecarboxylata]
MKKLFAALALAAVVAPVWAATQTVTLSVPGMTCASWPDHCQARAFQG